MNQALHIFGKDTRHLRWEILVSLALVAAYLYVAPYEWMQRLGAVADVSDVSVTESFIVTMSLAVGALTVLIPVSWWLVITRAVQTENLVGDQQWWVTKPYGWGSLLGAKLLFLAVFVSAPIFVVQCLLLARAGFHPLTVLPALGLHLVPLSAVIVLPLLAIATVTSTTVRSALTVLGLLLVFIVTLIAGQYVLDAGGFGFEVPGTGWLAVLSVVVAFAAIVLQYARRLAWRARLMMIAALVLLLATGWLSGISLLVGMVYRPASGPLQFALNPAGTSHSQRLGQSYAVGIPVMVTGIAPGAGVVVEGAQATVEAADGRRSTTRWQSQFGGVYLVDADPDSWSELYVRLKRSFLEQEAGKPVILHLRLAVAELRAGQPVRISMPDHEFLVPGFGICVPTEYPTSGQFNGLSCRGAAQQPVKTLIHVQWSDTPCSAQPSSDVVQGEGWAGNLERATELGLNPVVQVGFFLSNSEKRLGNTPAGPRFLCPGTPITFTPYRVARRSEYDATFANFVMPKEGAQPPPGGYSVGVQVGH